MKRLFDLFQNKFFLVTVVFLAWMIFFDKNDLLSQYEYQQEVNKLEEERDFYKKEIGRVTGDLDELTTNKAQLEKFAREKYLMKRENEDVFVIGKKKEEE